MCDAPIGDSAIATGGRTIDECGLEARTEFRVLRTYADGTSLVEVNPITGRTNQIRLHLWHLGWPVVGEQMYLKDRQLGKTQTHGVFDPPLCLHALRIAFDHPVTGERTTFECGVPTWAEAEFAR